VQLYGLLHWGPKGGHGPFRPLMSTNVLPVLFHPRCRPPSSTIIRCYLLGTVSERVSAGVSLLPSRASATHLKVDLGRRDSEPEHFRTFLSSQPPGKKAIVGESASPAISNVDKMRFIGQTTSSQIKNPSKSRLRHLHYSFRYC
jgi:hypothetical protein